MKITAVLPDGIPLLLDLRRIIGLREDLLFTHKTLQTYGWDLFSKPITNCFLI
jgi:hypothetical protein